MRVLIAVLLIATALPAAAQGPIAAVPVADGVWAIEGAVDRIGVLASSEGTLLVDSGYVETADGVRTALEAIGVEPPGTIVTTHWHHAFGNPAFPDATVIGHASLTERLSRDNRMYGREIPAFPSEALPDVAFVDSLVLRHGGETLQLITYGPAHTERDVVVFLEEAGVVFTGDLFVPHVPWVDVENGGDPRGWLAAIDELLGRISDDAVIVPGHDRISTVEDVRSFRDLLAEAIDRVAEGIREGRSREAIAAAGLSPRWDAWEAVIPIGRFLETVHDGLAAPTSTGVPGGVPPRPATCPAGPPGATAFTNGRWWDGEAFVEETVWAVDGWLTRTPPEEPVRTVDLAGGWVVPPLADAHTHRLAHPDQIQSDVVDHRAVGVLYAMNMDPMRVVDARTLAATGGPCGVDVAYTEGVIAPSWSVIADFYSMMAEAGAFGEGVGLDDLEGRALHVVDDTADLDAAWPRLAARNPAFLKVILAFSEAWEVRRGNPAYPADLPRGSAKPGIDPRLLPEIVRRARSAGIRVAAHVETAADFRVAVEAGVDLIAHLPGSWQVGESAGYPADDLDPWLLGEADARAAAERGVVVVTTAWTDPEDPRREAFATVHRHNVPLLRAAGAALALGSDGAPGSTVTEARHLSSLGVLSPRELLDLATRATARAVFPGRRIGRLDEGYEADFIVLDENPLEDPVNLGSVRLVVKDGVAARVR